MDGPPPANSGSAGGEDIKFTGTTPVKSDSIRPPASSESPAELGVRVAAIESSVQQLLSAFLASNIPRPPPADSSVDSKGKAAIGVGADSGEGSGAHSGSPAVAGLVQHASAATGFPAAAPGPSDGARRVFPVELDNKPYLPVDYYGQLIADGFRVQPYHGTADSKPHRFAIDSDETYKRIYDAFKGSKQAVRDIGAIQEYHGLYCNTFYLSCCQAALTTLLHEGVEPAGDNRFVISGEQLDALTQATKTLGEVERSLRDRFAFIRLKYDPSKDPEFEQYAAEQLHNPELDHYGSLNFGAMHKEFSGDRRTFALKGFAKASALKAGKGKKTFPSAPRPAGEPKPSTPKG